VRDPCPSTARPQGVPAWAGAGSATGHALPALWSPQISTKPRGQLVLYGPMRKLGRHRLRLSALVPSAHLGRGPATRGSRLGVAKPKVLV
jgi:hypothetical protein